MIDKRILFIWVGGNALPASVQMCVQNWRNTVPDFEILKIDESHPLFAKAMKNRFVKECYQRKLWAFVADYIRYLALYEIGGVYLDTDMQLIKDISPLLKTNKSFIGLENDTSLSCGIIASEKASLFIKQILDFYEDEIWSVDFYSVPKVTTYIAQKHYSYTVGNGIHSFADMTVYPCEYFYPYPWSSVPNFSHDSMITENSYAIHWWMESWTESPSRLFLKTKHMNKLKSSLIYLKFYMKYWLRLLIKK